MGGIMRSARSEAALVKELAEWIITLVRAVYIEERAAVERRMPGRTRPYEVHPKWDGKVSRRKPRQKPPAPIWPKIAKFILEHGLDLAGYIRQMFLITSLKGGRPDPNQLLGEAALTAFSKFGEVGLTVAAASRELVSERQALLSRVSVLAERPDATAGWIRNNVMMDENVPLSALFRYSVGVQEKLQEPVVRYWRFALVQYFQGMDAYDRGWGDLVPKAFREEARRYFAAICAEVGARAISTNWRGGEYLPHVKA
jgi:hypothetical protein